MGNDVVEQRKAVEGKDFIVVPLGDNLIAWISPEDADIGQMGWRAKKSVKGQWIHYYAVHSYREGSSRRDYYLHNLIWEKVNGIALPKGFLVDHINQDKLDNRRGNLRLATRKDNEANKRKRRTQAGGDTTSSYKGVSKMNYGKRKKIWRATLTIDKKQTALGVYETAEEAARAYDKAALEEFGEFAFLNFPEEHNRND